jgi:hypothetical protein
MKRIFLTGCVAVAAMSMARAQAPEVPEALSAWQYFKELRVSGAGPGWLDFVLDREILDRARFDQGDLRLYTSAGREIPYVLRTRREVETANQAACREFNRGVEGATAVVSCDLGERPPEHNVIEISTAGTDFRRMADVQGSPDGATWSTLASQAILFRFAAAGRSAEQSTVQYPASRHRYLRVRVTRDAQVDQAAPEIAALNVRYSIHLPGEWASFPAVGMERDADRSSGRPASVWRIDLGARIPVERLRIDTAAEEFSRPFQLEIVDDPAVPQYIASGELVRHAETAGQPLSVAFPERWARRLKLTVIDDRNPPLPFADVTAMSPARQAIFDASAAAGGPVRLYYGNPKALAPNYDLGVRVPADATAARLQLGGSPQRDNPIYSPEPRPFSERSPWLIYVVLSAACLALAAVLLNLARAAKALPQT